MKCEICEQLLVSIYIHDNSKPNKPFKKIGKICIHCDSVREPSEFFILKKTKLQKEKKEREQTSRSKPVFSEAGKCSDCGSVRSKKTKHKEHLHIEKDEGRNELICNRNNPRLHCECSICGYKWTQGLTMPREPKYELPSNLTKEKLRLAFLRVGSHRIKIPQKFKKMAMEIHKELKQERKAKEERELENKKLNFR